jgi:hypothetical protein
VGGACILKEHQMYKFFVTLAAAIAIMSAGSLVNSASAMNAGNPGGIRAALDDVAVTDQVHCRWGWLHHNWWYGRPHWDGCYHGRVIVGPRYFFRPRLHSYRVFRFRGGHGFRGGHHFRGGRAFFRGGRGGHGGRHRR